MALLAGAPSTALAYDYAVVDVAADGAATIRFGTPPGQAELSLTRGGTVWSGPSGTLNVPNLVPGETIDVRRDGAPYTTLTYTGLPSPKAGACAGSSAVQLNADRSASVQGGIRAPEQDAYGVRGLVSGFGIGGDWPRMELPRPLSLGDTLSITTDGTATTPGGVIRLVTTRDFTIDTVCPPVPQVPNPELPLTPALDLKRTRTQLGKLDPAKLARKQRTSLSVAVTVPGKLQLKLTAKQRKKTITLAGGTATAKKAGTVKVSLKTTKQGRALLRRSKRLKVSLTTTFTPVGTKAGKHVISATLKRPAKKR